MQLLLKSLPVLFFLTASCSSQDARYRDTTSLELPPALQTGARTVKPETVDDSALTDPEESDGKGLGSGVYMTADEPKALKIKQTADIAWNTVAAALTQSDIEIKDRDLDKGLYYVIFDPDRYAPEDDSVAGRLGSLFTNDYREAVYVLTLTADGEETRVLAARANQTEQGSLSDSEGDREEKDDKSDGADRLLLFVYKTLRDDLIEK